jgi:hypothetical protein
MLLNIILKRVNKRALEWKYGNGNLKKGLRAFENNLKEG